LIFIKKYDIIYIENKKGEGIMAKAKWEILADLIYTHFSLNEDFERDEIEGIAEIYGLSNGKIKSNTWKALFTHAVLTETSDGMFSLLPRKEKAKKTSSTKSSGNTLNIRKSNNQYYGQYIEEAVVAIINGLPIPNNIKNYAFQPWEIDLMNEDAKTIAAYLNASTASYVGRQTSNQSCDIIADGKEIELKYSKGNGTFYNTSISYFDCYGLTPFKQFLMDYGVLDFLAKFFGDKVYRNLSPVSQEESSEWRDANPYLYEQLQEIEATAREAYAEYVFNYLIEDNSRIEHFAYQMLTKETSGKHTPDSIIIYHYDSDKIVEFSKEEIMAMVSSSISRSGYTFKFNGFHTTIAWQNGTGLNNPTIRVYLDKKGK
jgi:hypothetical protein